MKDLREAQDKEAELTERVVAAKDQLTTSTFALQRRESSPISVHDHRRRRLTR